MADDAGATDRSHLGDDLFRPSIGQDIHYDPRPWNVASHVYVAFFGGVIAVTAIAYLNALRLHAGAKAARQLLICGAVGLVVATGVSYLVADMATSSEDSSRYVRLASRLVAVVLHFVMAARLKEADRRFQLAAGDYAPLWGPGFAAVIFGGIAQALILALVVDTV